MPEDYEHNQLNMVNIKGHEIDTQEFWKKRITLAKRENKLHYSVFLANDTLWNRLLEAHLEVIKKFIKLEDKVLDAGCGYGRMAQYFPNYTGIDFSEDFINEAKRLYPDKLFEQEDLRKLPYKDKYYDWGLVISIKNMIIVNMGEKAWSPMEKEIKRVCKKVLILEYGEMESAKDTKESHTKYEIL